MKENKLKTPEYQYSFSDQIDNEVSLPKGINEAIIRAISKEKKEPQWMLDFRLASFNFFKKLKNPNWGPDLSFINFDDHYYYSRPFEDWDNIPQKVKDTFERLGINEAESKYLSGAANQYDSEMVYHNIHKELQEAGVVFCDIETAVREHPELVKKYFAKIVPNHDNKYAALNSAAWSGGSFIYVPPGVHVKKPLQAYFRINKKSIGQFERTLIIVDKGAKLHYIEGCTAPVYDANNLHAAVVEVYVEDNAYCQYSTIQNWSDNVLNLVTKRAQVGKNATMVWIDGNIGAKLNMKYPATILKGDNSQGKCISIALAHEGVIQDSGAKMIHYGKNTKSQIISKSISHSGGIADYRGTVYIDEKASNARAEIKCDSLIIDDLSASSTYPKEVNFCPSSSIKHEAKITSIDQEKMFYLMSKGIPYEQAKHLIVLGFIEPFSNELPMEYAVELNRLLKMDFETKN